MKVINLYGGPGVGKSTTAAGIYVELKKMGVNVELRTEYAKDLLYEQREAVLKSDQLYILAKQHRRLFTLKDKGLDYVITDSPILLSTIYNTMIEEPLKIETFNDLVLDLYSRYDNIDIFIERNLKEFGYNPNGRTQTDVEEAKKIDEHVVKMLKDFNIRFTSIKNNKKITDKIIEIILSERLSS